MSLPVQSVSQPADVSVVIPVKDRAALLAEAIRSAQSQSPAPAEIIVVDDGSRDGSAEVAAALGATVIRHQAPQGPGPARNAGLRAATTEWVAFLDDDDVWLQGHLASLLWGARGDAVLVTAPGLTSSGRWRGNASGRELPLDLVSLLVPGDGIVTSGTMVRRALALGVGGCPERPYGEDLGLWLRMLAVGPGIQTATPTCWYREHGGQLSAHAATVCGADEAVVEAEAGAWITPRIRVQHRSRLVWDELRNSDSARVVLRATAWYVRHPVGVPALAALLAQRRRARRAAAELTGSQPRRPRAPGVLSATAQAATRTANETADITVVVPVRDRADLLAEALAGVAGQTLVPAEVVVVDDGSSDGSGEVARNCGARVIRHEVSVGPGLARNTGLAAAQTTWVAFLDSDDRWCPEHLASLAQSASADAVLVTAPGITSSGRWRGNARGRQMPLDRVSILVPGDGIVTSGTMVRRAVALAVGGSPDHSYGQDLGLWLRVLTAGPGVQTALPTCWYREHSGQRSVDTAQVRDAYASIVDAEAGAWLTTRLRARHHSRQIWDDARRSGSTRGGLRAAGWYAGHPMALPALGALLIHRRRARRAAAAWVVVPDRGDTMLLTRTARAARKSP